ncbi:MAG TPA: hydrogenase expression/formation protein HypE [Kofleriaceae bacterium]
MTAFGDCPLPFGQYDRVVLGHGSGGRLSAELVARVFVPGLGLDPAAPLEDAATIENAPGRIAMTTDSFVVRPLEFPGGDIGRLAITGTVNDLAVAGAEPRWISAAFILEEGLPLADLARYVASMRKACAEAEVRLVTGDTKVVERGKGDGVFITTTGVGIVPPGRALSIASAMPGDQILISGPLGDHGVAILSTREGMAIETDLESDVAPVIGLVRALLAAVPEVRCMRDPTRGGLASTACELAEASRVGVRLVETQLPVRDQVRAACELWGLDPLHMACEGRIVVVVPAAASARTLAALQAHPLGRDARIAGECVAAHPGMVTLASRVGGERIVSMLAGEPLPRIC